MDEKHEPDLEMFIHQELRRLPHLEAPPELTARVLAAVVRQENLPWWRKDWWQWPALARAISLSVFSLSTVFLVVLGWLALDPSSAAASKAVEWFGILRQPLDAFIALIHALVLILHHLAGQPWMLAISAVAVVLYLLLIGFGSAFLRVAMRKSSL